MQEKNKKKSNIPLGLKMLNKLGTEKMHLKIIRDIYNRSTASSILKGEKLSALALRSGTRLKKKKAHFHLLFFPAVCLLSSVTTLVASFAQEGGVATPWNAE